MANSETVDKILHAATILFAERGFAETSLRTITHMADVNLAAVNYHFGSKKALIQAVFSHFLAPFCEALDANLGLIDPKKPTVRAVLLAMGEAFLATQKKTGERPERFARLMMLAYTQSQEHLRQHCSNRYGGTLKRFINLLQVAAPNRDCTEFYWRMNFMLGAALFTLSSIESIVALLGKSPDDVSLDEVFKYLVPAMTSMLQLNQDLSVQLEHTA
ncbi:MAG: TetR/AcrR family transcriptional regulator [Marinagarivorans sp.]|nr:TetR/AcrR family transcriptional regulator [Marinagarivorans sp.]